MYIVSELYRKIKSTYLYRTSLYREYKLCKLLLKALDDRRSAARNSAIRGYSRQSGTGYDSSLSNSADNSANVGELDSNDFGWDWNDVRKSSLFKHMRPGSRAYSVPTGMAMGLFILHNKILCSFGTTMGLFTCYILRNKILYSYYVQ